MQLNKLALAGLALAATLGEARSALLPLPACGTIPVPTGPAPTPASRLPLGQDGARSGAQGSQGSQTAASLNRNIAEWELRRLTQPDWDGAGATLAVLQGAAEEAALASPLDPTLRGILADLQARVVLFAAETGNAEAVAEAVLGLRLAANERSAASPRTTVRLAANQALGRADVGAVIAAMPAGAEAAALPGQSTATDGAAISRAVRKALATGDRAFIEKLGSRAVPALKDSCLEMDGSPIPAESLNPLRTLLRVDPAAGFDVSIELVAKEQILLTGAVRNVIYGESSKCLILNRRELWNLVGEDDWSLKNPAWIPLLEGIALDEPVGTTGSMRLLGRIAARTPLTAAMERRLMEGLEEHPDRAAWIGPDVMASATRPFFERLLAHDNVYVRSIAVETFLASKDPDPAYRLHGDPAPNVRESLARSFRRRTITTWTSPARSRDQREYAVPAVTPSFLQCASAALLDPVRDVRVSAFNSIRSRNQDSESATLPAERTVALLRRAQADELRLDLLYLGWHLEPQGLVTVLTEAARLALADRTLPPFDSPEWNSTSSLVAVVEIAADRLGEGDYWRVMEALGDAEALPPGLPESIWDGGVEHIKEGGTLYEDLLRWMPRRFHDPRRAIAAVTVYPDSYAPEIRPWVVAAPGKVRASLLNWIVPQDSDSASKLARSNFGFTPSDLLGMITNPDLAAPTRCWAAERLLKSEPASFREDAVEPLVIACREEGVGTILERVVERLSHPDTQRPRLRDRLAMGLLADGAVPMDTLLGLTLDLRNPELLDAAVARVPRSEWASNPDSSLLTSIAYGILHDDRGTHWDLAPELNVMDSAAQFSLIAAIEATRRPEQLDLLREICLRVSEGSGEWTRAIDTVASYLNDEAAGILLELARMQRNANSREQVMARLAEVIAYQESAARWRGSQSAEQRRLKAVDRLVALSESDSQPLSARAEALRGLGLLGAVEELPRLIEALGSEHEETRAAAREAIDRLHREDPASALGSEDPTGSLSDTNR